MPINLGQELDLTPLEREVPAVASGNFSVAGLIALIFKIAIPLGGAIFLVLLLFGGFTYMTAGGNDENVAKAKRMMVNALIGLLLMTFAYGLGISIIQLLQLPTSITVQPANPTPANGKTTQGPTIKVAAKPVFGSPAAKLTAKKKGTGSGVTKGFISVAQAADTNSKTDTYIWKTGESTRLPIGKYDITATPQSGSGYKTATVTMDIIKNTLLSVSLIPTNQSGNSTITAQTGNTEAKFIVMDSIGNPLTDVRLSIQEQKSKTESTLYWVKPVDAQGKFTVDTPVKHQVIVSKTGYSNCTGEIDFSDDGTLTAILTKSKTNQVTNLTDCLTYQSVNQAVPASIPTTPTNQTPELKSTEPTSEPRVIEPTNNTSNPLKVHFSVLDGALKKSLSTALITLTDQAGAATTFSYAGGTVALTYNLGPAGKYFVTVEKNGYKSCQNFLRTIDKDNSLVQITLYPTTDQSSSICDVIVTQNVLEVN